VERDPLRVSGAWAFRGTRIPIAALCQNLEDGASLAELTVFMGQIASWCLLLQAQGDLDRYVERVPSRKLLGTFEVPLCSGGPALCGSLGLDRICSS
jgi:hypothetical protein